MDERPDHEKPVDGIDPPPSPEENDARGAMDARDGDVPDTGPVADGTTDPQDADVPDDALDVDEDGIGADDDTDEIPIVRGPSRPQAAGLWMGAGAVAGLVALVIFTGGLGSSGDSTTTDEAARTTPPPAQTTTTPPRSTITTSPAPAPATTTSSTPPAPREATGSGTTTATTAEAPADTEPGRTTPSSGSTPTTTGGATTTGDATTTGESPAAPATATPEPATPTQPPGTFTLTLRGKAEVYIEVKKRSEKGDTVFAGRVGNGVSKKLNSRVPLWLNVSWAPNAIIQIDGRTIPVGGGTEYYLARPSGLKRVTDLG